MTHSQRFPRALRPGLGLVLALTACGGDIQRSPVSSAVPYRDPALAPEARVDDLLARMTREVLELADAVVVAWLPGSEGADVADVLFGDVPFGGRLPYTWPESLEQLPLGAGAGDPLFPFGFGLTLEP